MVNHVSIAGKRILLAEDYYGLAQQLCLILESHEATVIGPKASLESAMRAAQGESIDAAVIDINLKNKMAYPLFEHLHSNGTPFVITSGYDEHTVPAEYAGAPRLMKPFDEDQLLAAINTAMAAQATE